MRTMLLAAALLAPVAAVVVAQPSAPLAVQTDAQPRDVSEYNLGKGGLAIAGYDPVSYFPEGGGKPAKGVASLVTTHRGVTYRFASERHKALFLANPDRYEPAHGGWCSTALADSGSKVEIDPKAFIVSGGRLFLFYKDLFTDARGYWLKDEAGNAVKADARWKTLSGEEARNAPYAHEGGVGADP